MTLDSPQPGDLVTPSVLAAEGVMVAQLPLVESTMRALERAQHRPSSQRKFDDDYGRFEYGELGIVLFVPKKNAIEVMILGANCCGWVPWGQLRVVATFKPKLQHK